MDKISKAWAIVDDNGKFVEYDQKFQDSYLIYPTKERAVNQMKVNSMHNCKLARILIKTTNLINVKIMSDEEIHKKASRIKNKIKHG